MKLISLNVEGQKHLDRVIPYLKEEQPDIICLQELLNINIAGFETALNKKGIYAKMLHFAGANTAGMTPSSDHCIGILSSRPLLNADTYFYLGDKDNVPNFIDGEPNSGRRALIKATIPVNGKNYTVITTHFTWSPDARPTRLQTESMERVLSYLAKEEEFIFCGDLNTHREYVLWKTLASIYKDNIPPEVKTTIDGSLHKKGPLPFVVDAMFTTPAYQVKNIKVVPGLSDHCAIVAEIV